MLVEKKAMDIYLGLINDEFVYLALQHYGFDNTWIVLPFMDINKRAIAVNRRSETARKAVILYKNELYILKEIPWYCSDDTFVNYEINLQVKLQHMGLPIPEMMKTLHGTYYTCLKDGTAEKFYFLQRFISGGSWDTIDGYVKSAGKVLAEMHNKAQLISDEITSLYQPPYTNVFDLADKMIDVLSETVVEKSNILSTSDIHIIKNFCEACKEKVRMNRNSAMEKGYSGFRMPIHGDYNPWNLIYHPQTAVVLGIVDFDNSIIDNPVHDVVEALIDFCFLTYKNQTTRFRGIPTVFNKTYGELFLGAYMDIYGGDIHKFAPYAKEVSVTISMELAALGLVRGDYHFQDCPKLLEMIEVSGLYIHELFSEIL